MLDPALARDLDLHHPSSSISISMTGLTCKPSSQIVPAITTTRADRQQLRKSLHESDWV
jgi:precorrin-6x reductase